MSEDFSIRIGETCECSFCHSKNTEVLEKLKDSIRRSVDKPQQPNTGMIKTTYYGNDGRDYFVRKILCLNCGQISNALSKEDLQKYNKDRPFFKNY